MQLQSTARAVFYASLLSLCDRTAACSRVTYSAGVDDRVVIGRTMDWFIDTQSTFWAFPAGLRRQGSPRTDPNSLDWTSKYGSVVNHAYDANGVEGMNSQGLTASLLYLTGSDYGRRNVSRPGLFLGMWLQYFLDGYATVDEAVADVCTPGEEKFQMWEQEVVPGTASVMYLAVSDKSGDNLIMEYIDGRLVCYHSTEYSVMTNEPSYDQQLSVDKYWAPIANQSLPGTGNPSDRFARLSYYNRIIPSAPDLVTAVAHTASMLRAVSVPILTEEFQATGLWPTLWRMYEDTHDTIIFYESALSPSSFWVDLKALDLSEKGTVKVLQVFQVPWDQRVGDMTPLFNATTFPLPAPPQVKRGVDTGYDAATNRGAGEDALPKGTMRVDDSLFFQFS